MNEERLTISNIFFRFILGFGAGLAGAIILGIILLLTWGIVGDVLNNIGEIKNEFGATIQESKPNSIFLFLVIFGVFVATLVSTLVYPLIISVTEERYASRYTTLSHIFFGNLVLFVFLFPVYVTANAIHGKEGIAVTALIHAILVAGFAHFIMQIINDQKRSLIHLYGFFMGLLLFVMFGNFLAGLSSTVLAFLTLPLLLGFLGSGDALAEVLYQWIADKYGRDFLNSDKKLSRDYAAPEKEV